MLKWEHDYSSSNGKSKYQNFRHSGKSWQVTEQQRMCKTFTHWILQWPNYIHNVVYAMIHWGGGSRHRVEVMEWRTQGWLCSVTATQMWTIIITYTTGPTAKVKNGVHQIQNFWIWPDSDTDRILRCWIWTRSGNFGSGLIDYCQLQKKKLCFFVTIWSVWTKTLN